jgi:hypothetical protein
MLKIAKTLLCLLLFGNIQAQSLLLSPNSTSPVLSVSQIKGYKASNLSNSSTMEMKTSSDEAIIQSITNSNLAFTVNDGPTLMLLSTNGYFGIGTSSPAERLDIKNSRIRFNGEKSPGNPSGLRFGDVNNGTNYRLEMRNDDLMRIFSVQSSLNLFQMNVNNGNVGINVDPQAEALTVAGSVSNKQFENVDNKTNILLSTIDGTLIKSPSTKFITTPWNITRFGNGSNNFVITNNFGYINTPSSAVLSAPLHFPNQVKLKSFSFDIIDNSAQNYIQIYIVGVNALTGNTVLQSSLNSKSLISSVNVQKISDTLLHQSDAENIIYFYEISIRKASDDSSAAWSSATKVGNLVFDYNY